MGFSFRTLLIASAVLLTSMSAVARGEDIKPLDKGTAAAILGFMGYQKVKVGAIADESSGVKLVLAVGVQNGKEVQIKQELDYDSDLGWFYFEFEETGANGQQINPQMPPMFGGGTAVHVKLRIWSASGYKAIEVAG